MNCPEVERVLDAYGDDELAPAQAADVRAHLETCAACHKRVAERAELGRLIRRVPYYAAPDRLRAAVATTRRPARFTPGLLAWAAVVTLAVSLGGATAVRTVRAKRATAVTSAEAQDVVSSHIRALTSAHLFDVQSTDQHTVKPWFQGKLDFSPPVDDLAPLGFPLVGGRVDHLAGRPVAALVYQRRQHIINVFVWPAPDTGAAPADARTIRGFQVRHWIRSNMAFWAVSDLNDTELDQFVAALR